MLEKEKGVPKNRSFHHACKNDVPSRNAKHLVNAICKAGRFAIQTHHPPPHRTALKNRGKPPEAQFPLVPFPPPTMTGMHEREELKQGKPNETSDT